MMKNLLLIIAVLMAGMVAVSCSKDSDSSDEKTVVNYEEAIVGKWAVTYSDRYETYTDIITFNGTNHYFEAQCSLRTYRGEYSVVENVIQLNEPTNKYPLDIIVISSMTESSFSGKWDDGEGEIKGTRIN